MQKEILFATNNPHKLEEIRAIAGQHFRVLSLGDKNFKGDIPETSATIAGNALQKARHIHALLGCDCFADDTGLEVEALGGAPGVYSARYAGENATYHDNLVKLLSALEGISNRRACFKTVIALILNKQEYLFEGQVCGQITTSLSGSGGFGYDPVFRPDGFDETFAEMSAEQKNSISHRALATASLIDFLLRQV